MRSKKEDVLELFFNSSKHYHFEELLDKAKISRRQLANWLKRFEKEGLIRRVKEKGRHPYYTYNFDDPRYRNRKRLYAMKMFTESGLFDHLESLEKAEVVILFGSFSREDWYENSDIDIFIYGSDEDFDVYRFARLLKREIQVFCARNPKEVAKMSGMLSGIVRGHFIKGTMHSLGVTIHAKGRKPGKRLSLLPR